MNIKAKQSAEAAGVLVAVYLILVVFLAYSPHISASAVGLPVKMLWTVLPYVLMVGLVLAVCKGEKRPVAAALGLKKERIARQLLYSLVIFIAMAVIFILVPLLCGVNKEDLLSFKVTSPGVIIFYIVYDMLFVGMGEELIWRGYFYERIKEITNSGTWAVVISAVLFGLWHFPNGHSIVQVLMTTLIGLMFGSLRLKVKDCSTLSTGIAHGLYDTVIFILSCILL